MEREVGTRQLNYKITDEKKIIEKRAPRTLFVERNKVIVNVAFG